MTWMKNRVVLAVLMGFPLVFLAVNRTWIYTETGFSNAWVCVGYYLHPQLLFERMPTIYKGSRVLHMALGWLAHRWLPVTTAIFVHKTGLFLAGYFCAFGLLRRLFRNDLAAVAGAAWCLTMGLTLYHLSWDYVQGTCIVLTLAGLWAQARMREARRLWVWQMLAGACFVGAVWTYLLVAIVAPLVFALFVYGLPRWRWRDLFAGLGWAALGGVVMTVAQAVISVGLGGPFGFFLAQLTKATTFVDEDWTQPLERWWSGAFWLPYFFMVGGLAVLGIWKGAKFARADSAERPEGRTAWLAAPLPYVSATYLVGLALFAIFQWLGIWVMLQEYALVVFLLPFSFPVVGGWLAWLMERLPRAGQWAVAAAMGGCILLVYSGLGVEIAVRHTWWALWLIPLIFGAALMGAGRWGWVAGICATVFALGLAGMNIYLADRQMLNPRMLETHVAFNRALYAAEDRIFQWDEAGQSWFWYALDSPEGKQDRILTFFHPYGTNTIGERFPSLLAGMEAPHEPVLKHKPYVFRGGMRVITMDAAPEDLSLAQANLAKEGWQLAQLDEAETGAGGILKASNLTLWQVRPIENATAVDLTQGRAANGVTAEKSDGAVTVRFPVKSAGAWWTEDLPKDSAGTGLWQVRVGGNARALELVLTDADGKTVGKTLVDPGTDVRDWWVRARAGTTPVSVGIYPEDAERAGSFVVKAMRE